VGAPDQALNGKCACVFAGSVRVCVRGVWCGSVCVCVVCVVCMRGGWCVGAARVKWYNRYRHCLPIATFVAAHCSPFTTTFPPTPCSIHHPAAPRSHIYDVDTRSGHAPPAVPFSRFAKGGDAFHSYMVCSSSISIPWNCLQTHGGGQAGSVRRVQCV